MSWVWGVFAIFASIGLHLVAVSLHQSDAIISQTPKQHDEYMAQDNEETLALAAFAQLDATRTIEAAVRENIDALPELDAPKIPIAQQKELPAPKSPAQTPKEPKPKTNPEKSEAESRSNDPKPAAKPVAKPQAPAFSQAQISQASINFQSAVHQAIGRAMRVPKNTRGVRAVVAVRFQNGRLVGYQIAQSSGHAGFDQAVIGAVQNASYPQPHQALPNDVTYRIPMSIN